MRLGGAIRGKWRIPDGKVESGLFSYSKLQSGSPHLSQLRTDCLASVSKFIYVLMHMRCMGSYKLLALRVAESDDTLPYLQVVHRDSA
jgi:hypothetical protein